MQGHTGNGAADPGAAGQGASAFLGPEFLLWLWHRTEVEGGEFSLDPWGTVGVAFDRFLELEGEGDGSAGDFGGKVTVRGELPTRLPEAAAALRSGRVPSVARLLIARGEESFELTLHGTHFDLKSLKVVASEEGGLPEDATDRARLLLSVPRCLDALYAAFLEERLSPTFRRSVLPRWREWIANRDSRSAGDSDARRAHSVSA